MGRFAKRLFKHPGLWMFLILAAVGIGMLAPLAAPALMIAAMVMLVPAFITTIYMYLKDMKGPLRRQAFMTKHNFADFLKNHKGQLAIVLLGIGLFITTLVCVIGFLTGGVGFAFMAPLFAAFSAPFAAAAAAGGISLAVPVLARFTLILASLNLTNIVKNIAAWFDSFTKDALLAEAKKAGPEKEPLRDAQPQEAAKPDDMKMPRDINWNDKNEVQQLTDKLIAEKGYLPVIGAGMGHVLKNHCVSEAGAKMDEAMDKIVENAAQPYNKIA